MAYQSGAGVRVDWDGDPVRLVQDFFAYTKQFQDPLTTQFDRDYRNYRAYVDPTELIPDQAFVFVPKIRSLVEQKAPQDTKALLAGRPYIPFTAKREEYKAVTDCQVEVLDTLLDQANFWVHANMAIKLKTLYGCSFMETTPTQEIVTRKIAIPQSLTNPMGGQTPMPPQIQEIQIPLLRLNVRAYAPWEIYVDPMATGFERPEQCRGVLKLRIMSLRTLKGLMATQQIYEGFDQGILDTLQGGTSNLQGSDKGRQMLQAIGLSLPASDYDLGCVFVFESPWRQVHVWNGMVALKEFQSNPYHHGLINLSRLVHGVDPHTQNQIFGEGESKPNEILQGLLNDQWSDTVNVHNTLKQPVMLYDSTAINPDTLLWTMGNRIPVKTGNRPIDSLIELKHGEPLPAEHFEMMQATERYMDLVARNFSVNRGELSAAGQGHTATEIALTKEVGDDAQEGSVKLLEQIFLKDFGVKALSIIDQFATQIDYQEILGPKAQIMYTATPDHLPGGYQFTFKGSDMVTNTLVKQRNLSAAIGPIQEALMGGFYHLASMLMDAFDFSEEEKQGIMQDAMIANQMLAQQQAMEMAATASKAQQPRGGDKSTQQNAQHNASVIRGQAK